MNITKATPRRSNAEGSTGTDLGGHGMKKRTQIITLRPGQPIPASEPRRYLTSQGYVRLRWPAGPYRYFEVLEHRVVDGRVTDAPEVHHINGVRDDNRPENLEHLSTEEHDHRHASPVAEQIVEMYLAGRTVTQIATATGIHNSAVFRQLQRRGVAIRSQADRFPKPDAEAVRRLHSQGVRPGRIAEALGVTHGAVHRSMEAQGLARFKPGRPDGS